MNPHFFTAPFYFAFIGSRFKVQGSRFKVQGSRFKRFKGFKGGGVAHFALVNKNWTRN